MQSEPMKFSALGIWNRDSQTSSLGSACCVNRAAITWPGVGGQEGGVWREPFCHVPMFLEKEGVEIWSERERGMKPPPPQKQRLATKSQN